MKYILFLILTNFWFTVQTHAQENEFEPIQCRHTKNGLEKRATCSRLLSVSNGKNVIGNACLFKAGQWVFGELKPDKKVNSTFKFRFKPKFTCSLGIVAINRDAQTKGRLGPSINQAFRKIPKVKVSKDSKGNIVPLPVPGYAKKFITYDSSEYYGTPVKDSGIALKDFDSKENNIVSCVVDKGKSVPCTNNQNGSSISNPGFCAPRNFPKGYVQDSKAFKGFWYVRYNQSNLMGFDVCKFGIVAKNAQEQADDSETNVQLIRDLDNILADTFISSYNDGDAMKSGLNQWFGAEDTKVYRKIGSCFVNQKSKLVRYSCNRRSLYASFEPVLAKNTDEGNCYAFKKGGWKIIVDTGATLKECEKVQLINTTIVEPSN